MNKDIATIYVGYDPREDEPYKILKYTAKKYASKPINVYPIKQNIMRQIGLYRRVWQLGSSELPKPLNQSDIQHRDQIDGKPFATDFSFSRFLTPFLNRLEGWALFMDCDMFFRSDPIEIFQKYKDEKFALYCVKHNHTQASQEKTKMYGNEQYNYDKKNWSSVMLFNCSHDAHKNLTVDDISTKSGRWLHTFQWIENYAHKNNLLFEDLIGDLPEEWNWLDGHTPSKIHAKNVHFTRGGPWFRGNVWEPLDKQSEIYSTEWETIRDEYLAKNSH